MMLLLTQFPLRPRGLVGLIPMLGCLSLLLCFWWLFLDGWTSSSAGSSPSPLERERQQACHEIICFGFDDKRWDLCASSENSWLVFIGEMIKELEETESDIDAMVTQPADTRMFPLFTRSYDLCRQCEFYVDEAYKSKAISKQEKRLLLAQINGSLQNTLSHHKRITVALLR